MGPPAIPGRFKVFPGTLSISGNMSVYFDNTALRDAFLNETEVPISVLLTGDTTINSSFMSLTIPRSKINSAQKSDGQQGLLQSMSYQALLNIYGGAGTSTDETTMSIQDSTLVSAPT